MSSGSGSGGGPCGACKFLRRKCVRGCVFAPYFDSDQGTAHFAAVHKVFGASNASKLLLRIPAHKRLDAVVTLCYEALARVRDPVYGCVAHIFTLQQQVVNLQAELAFVQARLSTLQQRLPQLQPLPSHHHHHQSHDQTPSQAATLLDHHRHHHHQHITHSISVPDISSNSDPINSLSYHDLQTSLQPQTSDEMAVLVNNLADHHHQHHGGSLEDGDLQTLTLEFVSKYLPGVKCRSSSSSH